MVEVIEEGVCATVIDVRELVHQSSRPLKKPPSQFWAIAGACGVGGHMARPCCSQQEPAPSLQQPTGNWRPPVTTCAGKRVLLPVSLGWDHGPVDTWLQAWEPRVGELESCVWTPDLQPTEMVHMGAEATKFGDAYVQGRQWYKKEKKKRLEAVKRRKCKMRQEEYVQRCSYSRWRLTGPHVSVK